MSDIPVSEVLLSFCVSRDWRLRMVGGFSFHFLEREGVYLFFSLRVGFLQSFPLVLNQEEISGLLAFVSLVEQSHLTHPETYHLHNCLFFQLIYI